MAQQPSFDLTKLSTADKILLGGGLLYFINQFLPWNRICAAGSLGCFSLGGWSGIGVLAGLLNIALLVWVGLQIAGVQVNVGINKDQATVGLAGGVVLFTFLRVIFHASFLGVKLGIYIFSWTGLLLSFVVLYGAISKMQNPSAPPPPASGEGFTA